MNRDNTVQVHQQVFQIEKVRWRGTLAGCRVTVCEHLDRRLTIRYGLPVVAVFSAGRIIHVSAAASKPNLFPLLRELLNPFLVPQTWK